MKRSEKIKSILKSRFAIGLVCVLIATYTFYHLVGMFDGELSTFAAGVTTEHTTIGYDGYIFRDEQMLYTSGKQGLSDYAVADGSKVSPGKQLATVYEKNAGEQATLTRIDEQIGILKDSLHFV